MAADKKDDKGLEIENSAPQGGGEDRDFIDLEPDDNAEITLSAGFQDDGDDDFASDIDVDVDITGDENIDFADEAPKRGAAGDARLKKIIAPALVLVVAAGVGGYIVMNPQILGGGGGGGAPSPQSYVAPAPDSFAAAAPQPAAQAPQTPAEEAAAVANLNEPFDAGLPQPTVNQNEVPRGPDDAFGADAVAASDITEPPAQPAASEPVAPEMAPTDVTEPAPVAEAAAQPPFPPEASSAAEVAPVAELQAEPAPVFETVPESVTETAPEPAVEPVAGDEVESAAEPAAQPEPDFAAAAQEPAAEIAVQPAAEQAPAEIGFEVAQAEDAAPAVPEMPAVSEPDQGLIPVPDEAAPAAAEETADGAVQPPEMAGTYVPETAPVPGQAAADTPVPPSGSVASASDTYYDGTVPTGPLAGTVGPRKIDPVMEPASQFVVVKKNFEAQDMESLLTSANRALKLKRYESALEMFNALYGKNSRDPRILMGRAVAQQNSGLAESAIRTYEELLDIKPDSPDAMLNMLGLIRQQYPSVALRRLLDLYEKYPNNAGIAAQIGITQADVDNYQDAMRYLGIASSLEPRNAQHMFNMAVIADRNGDTKQAIMSYEQALEMDAVYGGGRSIPRDSIYDRLATLRRR